jgi:hypothetical protein
MQLTDVSLASLASLASRLLRLLRFYFVCVDSIRSTTPFARGSFRQIVLILGFERPGDILDFTIPPELMDMHAIAEVMRLRPDFDGAQIDKAVGTFAAQMLSK